MTTMKVKLTEEEYNKACEMNQGEVNAFIGKMIPEYIHMGYGYYGASIRSDEKEHYALAKIGSSCD